MCYGMHVYITGIGKVKQKLAGQWPPASWLCNPGSHSADLRQCNCRRVLRYPVPVELMPQTAVCISAGKIDGLLLHMPKTIRPLDLMYALMYVCIHKNKTDVLCSRHSEHPARDGMQPKPLDRFS